MPPMQDELAAVISKDLGISDLPQDKQQELISQFGEIALKAATMAVMAKLTDATREEFMRLAEAGDAAAIQAFLNKEVPSHEMIAKDAVAEEVRRFKEFQASSTGTGNAA